MFRHHGKTRTLRHNLQIASLLSFVAGIVNVAGFLAVQRLTTNVTGHFAFFVDEVFRLNFWQGLVYFLYTFCFFLGSFISSFLIEVISCRSDRYLYMFPAVIECVLLIATGLAGPWLVGSHPNVIACGLLLAMGLQNSLVTTISNASVRTTHLTGLFTDLGIELSQLFFYREPEQRHKLTASIKLRLTIISFFFFGGIGGGILYANIRLGALIFAAATLLMGLLYDNTRFRLLHLKRKLRKETGNGNGPVVENEAKQASDQMGN